MMNTRVRRRARVVRTRRLRILALAALLLPLAAAADPDYGRARIFVGPLERSFAHYAPPSLARGAPLVIVLHGAGGSGERIRGFIGEELERLARRNGFAVAYPDGFGGNWNDCRSAVPYVASRRNIDDVDFLIGVIRWFAGRYGTDPARVRVIGFSNGAHMAFRLGLEAPERLQAVAAFGAGLPVDDELACAVTGAPPPLLLVNGTADPVNPFAGGSATGANGARLGAVRSSHATLEWWAGHRNPGDGPQRSVMQQFDDAGAMRVEWTGYGVPATGESALVAIDGGGHVIPWPGSSFPEWLGAVDATFNAIDFAVRFFDRQPRATASRTRQRPRCSVPARACDRVRGAVR